MLYIVHCTDHPERSSAIRTEHLAKHLAYLEQHADIILLGGARLADDGVTRIGSTLILNVPSRGAAVSFSENEPFRAAGLYRSVEIQRMRRAQWRPEIAPRTPDGN